MKVAKATDFQEVSRILYDDLHAIGYNPDLFKMLRNIEGMITDLSISEVPLRRTGHFYHLKDKVDAINKAIKHLENLILMARLMK